MMIMRSGTEFARLESAIKQIKVLTEFVGTVKHWTPETARHARAVLAEHGIRCELLEAYIGSEEILESIRVVVEALNPN